MSRREIRGGSFLAFLLLGFAAATTQSSPLSAREQPPTGAAPSSASNTTAANAPFVIEEQVTRYEFQDDGSGSRSFTARVLIRDQSGVAAWGTLSFGYMAANEEVALRRLVVEKPGGRTVKVDDAPLEDVTLTGQVDEPIVSDFRMKRVTVPALEPGDRLSYDVLIRRNASEIPGHFWFDHTFTRDVVVLDEVVEIDTPAARRIQLAVERGEDDTAATPKAGRRVQRWRHRQLTIGVATAAEPSNTKDAKSEAERPDIRVSSFGSWEELAEWFADTVAQRATADPVVTAKAAELVRGRETPRAKLEALYNFVADNVRYVSLVFGAGRLEPRASGLVLSTQYGDCKDKHTLLASLASTVGIAVTPVFISSTLDLDERMPSPSQFDHVISIADLGPDTSDRVWMDSTSGSLPIGALFANLRDKAALSAASHKKTTGIASRIVRTPANLPGPQKADYAAESSLSAEARQTMRVVRRLQGDAEYVMRLLLRHSDREQWLKLAESQAEEDSFNGKIVDAGYKDLGPGRGVELWYDGTYQFSAASLTKPWNYWVGSPPISLPKASSDERMSKQALDLGATGMVSVKATARVPPEMKARPPVPVKLSRPFADYESTYRVESGVLAFERYLVVKSKKVEPAQLESYASFQKAVEADYRQTFAMAPIAVPSSSGNETEALSAEARRALDSGHVNRGIELLERVTSLEPKHGSAWNNLGLAYLMARQPDRAIAALERQIAIDPFHENAYVNLGRALKVKGRDAEASAQYQKQIEVVPLHQSAHAMLGFLYNGRHEYAKAIESLERAVSIKPDEPTYWAALGYARLELGRQESALEAYDQAASKSPEPHVLNDIAWQLAEKGVGLEKARAYSQASLDAISAVVRDARLESINGGHLRAMSGFPFSWDTMGWIRFKTGDVVGAEQYLRAAWDLGQRGVLAEHVGAVAEHRGDKARAIQMYAKAAASSPASDNGRKALEQLVGADRAQRLIDAAREALVKDRTVSLSRLVQGYATGEVIMLVGPDGVVSEARFVKGDERLRGPSASIKGRRVPSRPPDGVTTPLIRGGAIGCSDAGCSLVLLTPEALMLPKP